MARIKRCSRDLHNYDAEIYTSGCPYCEVLFGSRSAEVSSGPVEEQPSETFDTEQVSSSVSDDKLEVTPEATEIVQPTETLESSESGAIQDRSQKKPEPEKKYKPQKRAKPQKPSKPKEKKVSILGVVFAIALIVLFASGGYGAYYYFSIYRPLHKVLPPFTVTVEESFEYPLEVQQGTKVVLSSDMPEWVSFDKQALRLKGTPPDAVGGKSYTLLFTTYYASGKEGTLTVKLFVREIFPLIKLYLECRTTRSGENIKFRDGFASLDLYKEDMLTIYVKDENGNVLTQGVINLNVRDIQ